MKRLVWSLLLVAASANAYVGFGVCNFGKETVPSVVCYGPTVLKETTVQGDTKIAGSLNADGITTNAMIVDGAVDVSNSTVNGKTEVVGALHASTTNFQKEIKASTSDMTLDHSVVRGSVTISSSSTTPYLRLQCSSAITGTVTFDGKPGVVQITGDSAVQGKVNNGVMEFVKKNCS